MTSKKSKLVNAWKKYTIRLVMRRFGNSVSEQKVDMYLDQLIKHEMQVPQCHLINNVRRRIVNTDVLAAMQSVEDCNYIRGGAATFYLQHDVMKNPLRDFIISKQAKRKNEKNLRAKYNRGEEPWIRYDRAQANTKVIINSLYGVLGYAKFILHNIFLAESITRMGRVIISTASCGFENFLSDNIHLSTESEVYEYVERIIDEYEKKYKDFDFTLLEDNKSTNEVVERIIQKCAFPVPASLRYHLTALINHQDSNAKLMIYYKNNFFKFNRIPVIKKKIIYIMSNIDELKLPDINSIENPQVRSEIEDLWKFYETFVFDEEPVYDSYRKMAYQSRNAVLYIDTDSNFISLSRWVHQISHEFFEDKYPIDKKEFIFVAANIITIFLSIVVDRNLKTLAKNTGITKEWRKFLSMKNEFFFWRILFGDVKKRYVDLMMIQEGKLLKDGVGIPEIKGYDFRKSVTKDTVRDYYTNICMDKILSPDEINLKDILMDVEKLKKMLKTSMHNGESLYFKQANVSNPEHYADPLRISGIKGVMLWNALMPEYAIELPSDVDLIPIKNISSKKWKPWFQKKHPEVYERLEKEIFCNRNPKIAGMTLNVIAKPKNSNIAMPDWLLDIMDTDKIINNTVKLFHPIMESLGMKIQKPTSAKEFLTNVVDL